MRLILAAAIALSLSTASEARNDNGRPADCPRQWCGCWLASHLGYVGRLARERWLAVNWLHNPRTQKRVGAVAVLPHHVGVVTGIDANGNPIILSGNHGRQGVGTSTYSARRVIAYVQP